MPASRLRSAAAAIAGVALRLAGGPVEGAIQTRVFQRSNRARPLNIDLARTNQAVGYAFASAAELHRPS